MCCRLLVTVHPLTSDMRMPAAPPLAPGTFTHWTSSTEPGQRCSGIRYLPQHLEACTRDNKPPMPVAKPIGFGISGPIRVAANNDGPGKDKELPAPLPIIPITMSRRWLSSAPASMPLLLTLLCWLSASPCTVMLVLIQLISTSTAARNGHCIAVS